MKTLRFSFNLLSRDAQLAFEQLPQLLADVHHEVIYAPALLSMPKGLSLLRLAFACSPPDLTPNRWVVETILRHVAKGGDPDDATSLSALTQLLAPQRDPQSPEVQQTALAASAHAIASGFSDEPVFDVEGRRFVGLVGLALMSAWLGGH